MIFPPVQFSYVGRAFKRPYQINEEKFYRKFPDRTIKTDTKSDAKPADNPMPHLSHLLATVLLASALAGCYSLKSSDGGGQVSGDPVREINPDDIALPDGYRIELVAEGLTFPTGVTFDGEGGIYVVESGYAYGEEWTVPGLIRVEPVGIEPDSIEPGGNTTTVVSGVARRDGPWNGVWYHENNFYIADGGHMNGGRLLRVSSGGEVSVVVDGLPSLGDHHTNGPVVSDGYLYFSQGTATNSGVVGPDNAAFGWLERHEEFHDVPCEDIVLAGVNYETDDFLNDNDEPAVTGAFSPYNTSTLPREIIKGEIPCSGAVMRVSLDDMAERVDSGSINGSGNDVQGNADIETESETGYDDQIELVAWGFRNPFGLAVSPDGELFVTDNSYDSRGSRPVWGTGDYLWRVEEGNWYGWPDYSGGKPVDSDEFQPPGMDPVLPLFETPPGNSLQEPPEPSARLGVHSSSNGLDFSQNPDFGYTGEAFIAQFGDMSPDVGKVMSPVGFKVVRVNPETGVVTDFAVNQGSTNGPASRQGGGGLERPVAVRFDPSGENLYIVDFGIVQMTADGPRPHPNTGTIWRISRENSGE